LHRHKNLLIVWKGELNNIQVSKSRNIETYPWFQNLVKINLGYDLCSSQTSIITEV